MDLSKVGEKILSSLQSARSLAILPLSSNRPQVPERAAAAAVVARAIAGVPPHERISLSSSSEEFSSIYGGGISGQVVEDVEEEFYEKDFDPVRHILEHISSEDNEHTYLDEKATLRIAQLDRISERLSRHVMEHHEEMVTGMHLVKELEQDLKVANVICMNGRRHLNSSMNEVSRDLVVTSKARKKQALQDILSILTELRHAVDMQLSLESHVEEGNYCKAFQVLSEYLQILDSLSELSAIQEMSRGVEVWLAKTLQKLDSLLLGVCQEFRVENYLTVVDAYALIGDTVGLAEKIQSFFMQEVLSETHSVLKITILEAQGYPNIQKNRLTYSDLCLQIPESKFRECLLRTLGVLYKLVCSYYSIMSFQPDKKESKFQTLNTGEKHNNAAECSENVLDADSVSQSTTDCMQENIVSSVSTSLTVSDSSDPPRWNSEARNNPSTASANSSPWDLLREDATAFVSQTLWKGRKNLWQLSTSRVSVLLCCSAVCSTSVHQFLKNYEDLNVFILAGESFCGVEAVEFRQKLKTVCENYFTAFHRQNIYALKMVLEKEGWQKMSSDTIQVISFAGLVGDGAPILVQSDNNSAKHHLNHSRKPPDVVQSGNQKDGFAHWVKDGNPFLIKLTYGSKEYLNFSPTASGATDEKINDFISLRNSDVNRANGRKSSLSEDENEDLLADFIDEDSQLPSRIPKPYHSRTHSSHWNEENITAQTGSSLCLLRLMDKYARLMQKLEIVNIEFFKGICQLFQVFFHHIFETFGQRDSYTGKGLSDPLTYKLKITISRITQECDQWIKPQLVQLSSSTLISDVTPTNPLSTNSGNASSIAFGLKERCAGAETLSLVAEVLLKSRSHLQSMIMQTNATVEDLYTNLVGSVPDLVEHVHRTTARLLLPINGYVDRIANAKELKESQAQEHNGYVDLLLGEFKHYKTRLAHGGIQKEVQDLLLEYGLDNVAETLIEGLSRVKRCTDEGRGQMQLDNKDLIEGLERLGSKSAKMKLQIVDTYIKAFYLPETEWIHWVHTHPEYSRAHITALVNLVASMKGWRRKVRLEVLESIEFREY